MDRQRYQTDYQGVGRTTAYQSTVKETKPHSRRLGYQPISYSYSYSYNTAQNADTYPYNILITYYTSTLATCLAYSYSYNTVQDADTYPYNTYYINTPATCLAYSYSYNTVQDVDTYPNNTLTTYYIYTTVNCTDCYPKAVLPSNTCCTCTPATRSATV